MISNGIKNPYFIFLTTKEPFFLGLFLLNACVVISWYPKKLLKKQKRKTDAVLILRTNILLYDRQKSVNNF